VIRTVNNPEAKTWPTLSNAEEAVPLAEVVYAHAWAFRGMNSVVRSLLNTPVLNWNIMSAVMDRAPPASS